VASDVLLPNIYTILVDANSCAGDLPNSIATARHYFKLVNPGTFFRVFSPANQVLALLALMFCWKKAPGVRFTLGAALALYVLGDMFTFAYFYPRNELMFSTASLTDVALLRKTVSEWATMNWVRSLIMVAGLCFSFISLHRMYTRQQPAASNASMEKVQRDLVLQ